VYPSIFLTPCSSNDTIPIFYPFRNQRIKKREASRTVSGIDTSNVSLPKIGFYVKPKNLTDFQTGCCVLGMVEMSHDGALAEKLPAMKLLVLP
jgi:hypothetical protein